MDEFHTHRTDTHPTLTHRDNGKQASGCAKSSRVFAISTVNQVINCPQAQAMDWVADNENLYSPQLVEDNRK